MAVSFCGIIVILNRGDLTQLARFHFNPGDLVILGAMPIWGVYCVLLPRRPPGTRLARLLFIIAVIGDRRPGAGLSRRERLRPRAAARAGRRSAPLLYIGCVASVLAYICWNRGVELVGPNRAGFTMHLLPAFTTILAVVILGETLHLFHVVGIATILFGVWLATSARGRRCGSRKIAKPRAGKPDRP